MCLAVYARSENSGEKGGAGERARLPPAGPTGLVCVNAVYDVGVPVAICPMTHELGMLPPAPPVSAWAGTSPFVAAFGVKAKFSRGTR